MGRDRFFGGVLRLGVERRVNGEPAVVQGIVAVFLFRILPDQFDEIRGVLGNVLVRVARNGQRRNAFHGFSVDKMHFLHGKQHRAPARCDPFLVCLLVRAVALGKLNDPRKHRAFIEIKLGNGLLK